MKKRILFYFLIIIFISCRFLYAAGNGIPVLDVKVNYLSDAEAYYIVQALWLPDKPASLITVFFNSDGKTFWRYVINNYDPVNDVYTTLFEEQETRDFYIKLFFYNNGDLFFLKKFNNHPFDTNDYVVMSNVIKRNRVVNLLKKEKSKLQDKKNMLNKEIKGRLVNCSISGCLKEDGKKIIFVRKMKNNTTAEEFLFENVSNPLLISGTDLVIFEKHGEYFIYSIDQKKILYRLNFIESYSKFKVNVIKVLDFAPQGKYILFETTGNYKGRNKKSVGTLAKEIFK